MNAEMLQEARKAGGALRVYLQEMQHDLLTKEEEQELGRRIRAGDHNARNELVESNLRLVVAMVHRHINHRDDDLISDLIQEGNLGLMRAAEKFDPALGWRFSTYATWWILQMLSRAFSKQSFIAIPDRLRSTLRKVMELKERIQKEHDRLPTLEEMEQLQIHDYYLDAVHRGGFFVTSVDASFSGNDDGNGLLDVLSNATTEQSVMRGLEQRDGQWRTNQLLAILENADVKEGKRKLLRRVVVLNFGLEGCDEGKNKTQIAKELGISVERVSSLLNEALRRMKTFGSAIENA